MAVGSIDDADIGNFEGWGQPGDLPVDALKTGSMNTHSAPDRKISWFAQVWEDISAIIAESRLGYRLGKILYGGPHRTASIPQFAESFISNESLNDEVNTTSKETIFR